MISVDKIRTRMMDGLFSQDLMDNTFRGIWCEYMVAEALGPECKTVGAGWHAWDLQIGENQQDYPDRIRIQVKNSARLQPWNKPTLKETNCAFQLTWRKRPYYFQEYNKRVPCEPFGFLCDVYVLCWHNEVEHADHRDLSQWRFFVVPVKGPNKGVTENELKYTRDKSGNSKSVSFQRRPDTLKEGIRGRPPIQPIGIDELSVDRIRQSLGLC